MEGYIYLIGGIILLLIVFYDFFYTTLSGSGAGFLSKSSASFTHKILLLLARHFSPRLLHISGMIVNLTVLAMWILLVWLGLFLVYSYDPEAIENNQGRVASTVERIYFTGYVLSTLGIGNFNPTTPSFEIITSLFSFFGFGFFTTAMTYLLSVSSAVVHKRSLSLSIHSLGRNPAETVTSLFEVDSSFRYQQILALQQMINQHSTYYQAYPVLHFYHNTDDAVSLSVKIAVLDEAVSIMLNNCKFNAQQKELQQLRDAINQFLRHLKVKYGHKSEDSPDINWHRLKLPENMQEEFSEDPDLSDRRKVLTSLLHNENRSWKDVYPELG